MSGMSDNMNQVASVLEEEFTLYKTLLRMTIAQKKAAEAGDVPAIISILRDRVKIIARLDALSLKTGLKPGDKLSTGNSRVSGLVASINELINRIIECDSKSCAAMSEINKGIEERLSGINNGLHKVKCMPRSQATPRFISLKL